MAQDFCTKNVYSKIAHHFSQTRYKRWPVVARFLEDQDDVSFGLDLGCGNGKNMQWSMLGVDNCPEFLDICQERGLEVLLADISMPLPFRPFFDHVICIAVLHHLPDPSTRMMALKGMKEALLPGAKFLIFVWALEGNESVGRHKELVWLNAQDVLVPWHQQDDVIVQRFYHLFREGELEELVTSVDDLSIDVSGYDKDNWYVTGHRVASDDNCTIRDSK
jgi:tRNA (uracil-5-)-methyltransferase TRM9